MALMQCPECGAAVSTFAKACPKCGYPIQDAINQNNSDNNLNSTNKPTSSESSLTSGTSFSTENKTISPSSDSSQEHAKSEYINWDAATSKPSSSSSSTSEGSKSGGCLGFVVLVIILTFFFSILGKGGSSGKKKDYGNLSDSEAIANAQVYIEDKYPNSDTSYITNGKYNYSVVHTAGDVQYKVEGRFLANKTDTTYTYFALVFRYDERYADGYRIITFTTK